MVLQIKKTLTAVIILLLLCRMESLHAQALKHLNTAEDCKYMKPEEIRMIYEINIVRTNPKSYLSFIRPMLELAENILKNFGKGDKSYSVRYTTRKENGKTENFTDTIWHYRNEEEVKALRSLVEDLSTMQPLGILKPDKGVYEAARKHAMDQDKHKWTLLHTGSDGSQPWDRITKFSPGMEFGNENLAGRFPEPDARTILIQLLIDAGISGYGHRYNILDPQWKFAACYYGGLKEGMHRWVQEFAR